MGIIYVIVSPLFCLKFSSFNDILSSELSDQKLAKGEWFFLSSIQYKDVSSTYVNSLDPKVKYFSKIILRNESDLTCNPHSHFS